LDVLQKNKRGTDTAKGDWLLLRFLKKVPVPFFTWPPFTEACPLFGIPFLTMLAFGLPALPIIFPFLWVFLSFTFPFALGLALC